MASENPAVPPSDFGELHSSLLKTESVEQFLKDLASLAAGELSDGVSCGITVQPEGQPFTAGYSDDLAARADEVQYKADRGPCLHALRDRHIVRVDHIDSETRWPEFENLARSLGLRSCLAVPLRDDQSGSNSLGAINLYAQASVAFGGDETRRALRFARNAAGALALARRLAAYVSLTAQLRSAMAARSVIDQALGIIMAREGCGPDRAFEILRATSQRSNVKIRDIATSMVTRFSGEPPRPVHPFQEG